MKLDENELDPIDILEQRIRAMELQILPGEDSPYIDGNQQTVSDLLLETETMISSALSCRKPISSILQKMKTINDYLDPLNGEDDLEVQAKKQYLLHLYPDFIDTLKVIQSFEGLLPFNDPEGLIRATEFSAKLNTLAAGNLEIYEDCRKITQKVLTSLQKYNDITNTIKVVFAQLDKVISELEFAENLTVAKED